MNANTWVEKRGSSYYCAPNGKILASVRENGSWRDKYYWVTSYAMRGIEGQYITREHAKRAIEDVAARVPSGRDPGGAE